MPYRDPPSLRREMPTSTDAARERRLTLPLLDNLRIASPCAQSWEEMEGDERVRFCWRCEKNVYNLSALTREEAERLVFEREGRMCARFYRRADGTILTSDCPPGRRRSLARRWVAALAAGVLAVLGVRSLPAPSAPLPLGGNFHGLLKPEPKPPRKGGGRLLGVLGMGDLSALPPRQSQFTGFEILQGREEGRATVANDADNLLGGLIGVEPPNPWRRK
jgi:hypothetical protein